MRKLDFVENESLRRDLPPFKVGDTVAVHVRVREGDKERIQVFQGLVIRRRGAGIGETFTVRKISSGVGVERIFPVQSPLVTKVDIKARGYVRRSRLYYLRDLSGKKARLHSKVRDLSGLISEEESEAQAAGDDMSVAPPEAEVAEVSEADSGDSKVRGKARKKLKAAEKAKRKVELDKQEAQRAAKKAKEAEAAEAKAKAEADAASEEAASDDGADASDASEATDES